jgi:aminoglycoside/choline kinase family phosphotransferase/dTDP-glucose pyrophosphorylase
MKALILAAGLGTRLRPYTDHRPKALFTINQRPLLAIIVEKLQHAGFESVLVNAHHHFDQIEDYVANARFAIPVTTFREVDILGTGGAIRNVSDSWKSESLLVINADVVSDIDPAGICGFHQSHGFPVTMVMHDRAAFNSVCVDAQDFVTGFHCGGQTNEGNRVMAFTGIHVIDRKVLDFLPGQGPAHIIDAYDRMLKAGERIKACVVRGHYWQDIGAPERYQAAAFDQMAPLAFEAAFGIRPKGSVQRHELHGDGSDRRWYRLTTAQRSLIMADHGIRTARGQQEVDAYISIGKHLYGNKVAVPRIYMYDNCAGLAFVEDAGDEHLQTVIGRSDASQQRQLYQRVIDQWITMAMEGYRNFDPSWTYQSARYDRQVILEKECRYFVEAFVQTYLGWQWTEVDFRPEFERIALEIGRTEISGFLHRDFQSRNIMIQNQRICFIDFQGGRVGPIQYDLASLLIDPYAALSADSQDQLKAYGGSQLDSRYGVDLEKFNEGYDMCAISRNLQILGAFAFLSRMKGKTRFEKYIPCAVHSLVRNLIHAPVPLPKLTAAARKIAGHIAQRHCEAIS